MESMSIGHLLTVARIAMRFGQVRRVTLHEDGEQESDATHTVMLALAAIEVAPLVGCDAGLAAQFATVHDLPERYEHRARIVRQRGRDEISQGG